MRKFSAFLCTGIQEKQPLVINSSIIPCHESSQYVGFPGTVIASTIKSDRTQAPLPLVLPHQDVISSLKAYRADSNDIE